MKYFFHIIIPIVIGFILGGGLGLLIGSIAGLLLVIIEQIGLVITKLNVLIEKTKE